jgi:hypothetical protein
LADFNATEMPSIGMSRKKKIMPVVSFEPGALGLLNLLSNHSATPALCFKNC